MARNLDIQVFWREISGSEPAKKYQPDRRELCPVPFHRFRESFPALRKAGRIWRRTYRKGWEFVDPRDSDQIYPGQVYLLEKSCGGYNPVLVGRRTSDTDFDVAEPHRALRETLQDDEEDADDLSQINKWLTVFSIPVDVCEKLDAILAGFWTAGVRSEDSPARRPVA